MTIIRVWAVASCDSDVGSSVVLETGWVGVRDGGGTAVLQLKRRSGAHGNPLCGHMQYTGVSGASLHKGEGIAR